MGKGYAFLTLAELKDLGVIRKIKKRMKRKRRQLKCKGNGGGGGGSNGGGNGGGDRGGARGVGGGARGGDDQMGAPKSNSNHMFDGNRFQNTSNLATEQVRLNNMMLDNKPRIDSLEARLRESEQKNEYLRDESENTISSII